MTVYARENARKAGANGRRRSEFVDAARRALGDYRQGRAAGACMADIEAALTHLDARRPRNQGAGPPADGETTHG